MIPSMANDQQYKLQQLVSCFGSDTLWFCLTVYLAELLSIISIQRVFSLWYRRSPYGIPFDIGVNYCSEAKKEGGIQ